MFSWEVKTQTEKLVIKAEGFTFSKENPEYVRFYVRGEGDVAAIRSPISILKIKPKES